MNISQSVLLRAGRNHQSNSNLLRVGRHVTDSLALWTPLLLESQSCSMLNSPIMVPQGQEASTMLHHSHHTLQNSLPVFVTVSRLKLEAKLEPQKRHADKPRGSRSNMPAVKTAKSTLTRHQPQTVDMV